MAWWEIYKLWSYTRRQDPFSQRLQNMNLTGAGTTQPDAIPDVRASGENWSGSKGVVRLRDSNDFVDLSTVQNRISRYKEYERLRAMAEIETVLQIFADEACVIGSTLVSTLEYGPKPIWWLAKNKKDERFAVYCWDFEKQDYTVGWAFDPRKVKEEETIKVKFSTGDYIICTPDHKLLLRDQTWIEAKDIKQGDHLMPFHRVKANQALTEHKKRQFPRIFTFNDGWTHERWFIEKWRDGEVDERTQKIQKIIQMVGAGISTRKIEKEVGHQWFTIKKWLDKEGFSWKELKKLYSKKDYCRVLGVEPWRTMPVYDLSVEKHENFATDFCIAHNCQKNDKGNAIEIHCENKKIKDELEFLFYNRGMLNINRRLWSWAKNLFAFGDFFLECIINPNNPKDGILKVLPLPPESMFKLETTKGKVIEFQQSKEGPDFQALTRAPITQATEAEVQQSTAIRFHCDQIVHMKIGEDRSSFYPYGVSIIEPARGPAHQLRLMEDAMVVYRLTRAPERRVFYVDVGQLPPFKAEAFMERMKDMYRKKKVAGRNNTGGANTVEERWHAPAQDEDFWIPTRPNTNTRVETLPGAQNLGEIDDAVYFRNKLYTALQFPKNYLTQEDPGQTRITLSAQDVKFARTVERLQDPITDGLVEIAQRHLHLRGFPEEMFDDLQIKMTAPSDWRELSRAEVTTNRLNNASNLKGSQLMPDYDIYVDWLKMSPEEAEEKLTRLKIQKIEDLKLQVLASNPPLLGVGQPGQGDVEVGADGSGPNPMMGPGGPPPMGDMGGGPPPTMVRSDDGPPPMPMDPNAPPMDPNAPPMDPNAMQQPQGPGNAPKQAVALPDIEKEDIKKYDLEIRDYEAEQDAEDIDYSEV